ncbi:MAG TPA: hypothetical protein VMS86_13180 [Thermoanaerobaculia bacterium]|nr:hypothetical protein [Thermoanaerobaculia bacterium]
MERKPSLDGMFVRRRDLPSGPVLITSGALEGRWSPDGSEIYLRSGEKLMVVNFTVESGVANPGAPRLLFELPGLKTYQPIPGMRDFITLVEEPGSGVHTSIAMVQNWTAEVDAASSTPRRAP